MSPVPKKPFSQERHELAQYLVEGRKTQLEKKFTDYRGINTFHDSRSGATLIGYDDSHVKDFVECTAELHQKLVAEGVLKKDEPLEVLDLGAGKGVFLSELKQKLLEQGIKVNAVGTNITNRKDSISNRGDSKHFFKPGDVEHHVCYAEKLKPEWTNRFLTVVSTYVFPYVRDKLKALEEVSRVLHPNGFASISDFIIPKGMTVKDFEDHGISCEKVSGRMVLTFTKLSKKLPFRLIKSEKTGNVYESTYERVPE